MVRLSSQQALAESLLKVVAVLLSNMDVVIQLDLRVLKEP